MSPKKHKVGIALIVGSVVALSMAAWATGSNKQVVGAGTASATKSVCGSATARRPQAQPIKLGGIAMLIPGVDFTTIGKVAEAYYDCVNDNGGINGRPIAVHAPTRAAQPGPAASLAKKLVETDKVVGIVGNTSLSECSTNEQVLQEQRLHLIGAGVPGECFASPNIVEVNMGPRYSNIGATQAIVA